MKQTFKRAFTLAEVLIVLTIIGVVAAMTLPNLTDDVKDRKMVTKVRKIYGELDHAFGVAQDKYGVFRPCSGGTYTDGDWCSVSRVCETMNTRSIEETYSKCTLNDGTVLVFDFSEIPSKISIIFSEDGEIDEDIFYTSIMPIRSSSNIVTGYGLVPYINKDTASKPNIGQMKKDEKIVAGDDSANEAVQWIIQNGNMDYLKCKDTLTWGNVTSCN